MSLSPSAVAVQGIGFGPLAIATQGLREDAQKPRAVAVQGIGFGRLSIATQGFRGVRGFRPPQPGPEIVIPRRGGSSGRDAAGSDAARQRAHRQALIRQQNDLILAIAVAVAGSGALD